MVNSYVLVNPHLEGDFKTKIKAKNSKEAAQKFYKELSGHFSNAVPLFHFTIQKGGSGSGNHYHFEVTEDRKEQKVDFNIKKIDLKDESKVLDKFVELAQINGRYFLCDHIDLITVANWLHPIPMSLADKFLFSNAPVAIRDHLAMQLLYKFAAVYALGRPVGLNIVLNRYICY